MNIRALFLISALLPLQAIAYKGDFSFKVANSTHLIPSSCVESPGYNPKDEVGSENVVFSLTTDCRKHLAQITRQYIGGKAVFSYRDNKLSPVVITSVLGSSFRISSKEISKIVLMQMLNDYGVKNE